jgi:AraC-like DNA-binding protein
MHRSRVLGSPWKGVYGAQLESSRHFGRHSHDAYGFGFLEHGAHRSASGRGNVDAYAGELITTNPGEIHDGRPLAGPSRRWRILYVEPPTLVGFVDNPEIEVAHPVIRDPALLLRVKRVFARIERWREFGPLACEEALVEACTVLLARYGTLRAPREASADLRGVRERLADELVEPPDLAEMARMTGLSRFQLLRRFERCYGVPPHAWLRQKRAERARAMIRDGATLSAAAAASGFADQSHMTRVFVRQFGFTPGAWRAAHLQ